MLIKIGGKWINPAQLLAVTHQNQNVAIHLANGETIIKKSLSENDLKYACRYSIPELSFRERIEVLAPYIEEAIIEDPEEDKFLKQEIISQRINMVTRIFNDIPIDDCTCEQYGYCKTCGRPLTRSEHLFKTEETK